MFIKGLFTSLFMFASSEQGIQEDTLQLLQQAAMPESGYSLECRQMAGAVANSVDKTDDSSIVIRGIDELKEAHVASLKCGDKMLNFWGGNLLFYSLKKDWVEFGKVAEDFPMWFDAVQNYGSISADPSSPASPDFYADAEGGVSGVGFNDGAADSADSSF